MRLARKAATPPKTNPNNPLLIPLVGVFALAICGNSFSQVRTTDLALTDRHVPELGRHLDRLQLSEPVIYQGLAVYTLQLIDGDTLDRNWLTLDDAVERGTLVINEKGSGGTVPTVTVENKSENNHVLITAGEIIKGAKQTRTVRNDVIVAPGQKINLSVFCVEHHRWHGGAKFAAGKTVLPQSIRKELRKGADQSRVWSEVARNNDALSAQNSTGSLELALNSPAVQEKLGKVRRNVIPEIPQGTTGFLFVHRGQAMGIELFGSETIAREILPKLIDSYAVDFVLQSKSTEAWRPGDHSAAIAFYNRVRRVGSSRTSTPGSGAGIKTKSDNLLGDGVSLNGTLAHYGLQIQTRVIKPPKPSPIIPVPQQYRNNIAPQSRQ